MTKVKWFIFPGIGSLEGMEIKLPDGWIPFKVEAQGGYVYIWAYFEELLK